jgi:phosphonate transport system substrate-binding protein
MKRGLWILAKIALMLILAGCERQAEHKQLQYSNAPTATEVPIYRLMPHPLYNPQTISKLFQPLVDRINSRLTNGHVVLEASRDYQAYEQKFRARDGEILMPNPWQTLEAMKVGYHVIAMWGDAEDFRGVFIVRKDGDIKTPQDLKGKVVSYPSPTALAACLMPQFFLYQQGININQDIQNKYVGSQESSIMNVYMGDTAAGATWPPPWRLFQKEHPKEAAELSLAWETAPLLNNSVMVRNDVPPVVRDALQRTLLDLQQTPEGKAILSNLQTAQFHSADDNSYEMVRKFIREFELKVRPVESR